MRRGKRSSKSVRIEKVVDEEMEIECCAGPGKIREEAWQDSAGNVVRYNLAFIHHFMCKRDNGRVLGYDASHDHHHRHFMGQVEKFTFVSYAALSERFFREVAELCKRTNGEKSL